MLDTAHLDGIIPTNTTTTAPLATKLGPSMRIGCSAPLMDAEREFCLE